jgi:hypothetical protein
MKNLFLLGIVSFICGFILCLALIWCRIGENLTFRKMMDALMQKRKKNE